MLPSPLRITLAAFAVYTVAVSAVPAASTAPSLTVKSSTQNVGADGLRSLRVTATVSNTGDETSRLSLGGALISDNSRLAAERHHPSAFTVLAPGDSINATHDPSAAHNLIQSGAGDYSIEPPNLFAHVNADGTPKDFYPTVGGVKHSRDLAAYKWATRGFDPTKYKPKKYKPKKPKPDTLGKQPTFRSCPNHREIEILTIAKEAEEIIDKTYAYVKKLKHPTPRYTTWYGTNPGTGMGGIQRHWKKMSKNELTRLSTFWYGCSCPKGERSAIVYERSLVQLTLCPPFWKLPPDEQVYSLISRASTIPENGFATDYAEGEADCEKLARGRPENAGHNADSFKYFAWNKERLE